MDVTIESSDKQALDEWEELMGSDLKIKFLHRNKNAQEVQLNDAVRFSHSIESPANVCFTDWLVVVGKQTVVPALEMGLRFMHEGDEALVQAHSKYALGLCSRVDGENNVIIPPGSTITFNIQVTQVIPQDEVSAELQVKILQCQKTIANDIYKYEWSDGAALPRVRFLYSRSAKDSQDLLMDLQHDYKDITSDLVSLQIDSLNNLSAAFLRASKYKLAKEAAVQVLQLDSRNAKALLRAARASLYDPASTFDEVEAALQAAAADISNDSDRKDLHKLQRELKQQRSAHKQSTKSSMFGKLNSKMSSCNEPKTKDSDNISADTTSDVHIEVSTKNIDTQDTISADVDRHPSTKSEAAPLVQQRMSERTKFVLRRSLILLGVQLTVLAIAVYIIKRHPHLMFSIIQPDLTGRDASEF